MGIAKSTEDNFQTGYPMRVSSVVSRSVVSNQEHVLLSDNRRYHHRTNNNRLSSPQPALGQTGDNTFKKSKTRSALNIIEEHFHRLDITIVNSNECPEEIIKNIYELGSNTIIQRTFDMYEANVYHESYLICSVNNTGLFVGLQKLSIDFFWNPSKRFIIFLDSAEGEQIYETFERLKYYEITSVVIIVGHHENQEKIYAYNIPDGTGCEFSVNHIISTDRYEIRDPSFAIFPQKVKRDYSNCNVTILSNYKPPFGFMNGYDVSEMLIGLCDIYLKIMDEVAYYNFTILSERDLEFGVIMPNKSVTGLLKRLHTHEIDGAAAGMVLNWNRLQLFDFTTPNVWDQFIIVVPKAPLAQRWKSFFSVYDTNTWLLIFVAYIMYPPLAMHFHIFHDLNKHSNCKEYYFICFGYILAMPNGYTSNDFVNRILLMFWIIFTWFVNVCFVSVLASVVTAPVQLHQINTIKELKENRYEFHINKNAYLQEMEIFTDERHPAIRPRDRVMWNVYPLKPLPWSD
ncbi:Glutamate receptor [Eumeta japonica]|uniref:Glutamate receptor n=1 Tax=Eumeta variegata TaxID=151549 RepID=A0A4C1TMK7_EUMVA|nr:Glutamate receptor [Eumeta japonica]